MTTVKTSTITTKTYIVKLSRDILMNGLLKSIPDIPPLGKNERITQMQIEVPGGGDYSGMWVGVEDFSLSITIDRIEQSEFVLDSIEELNEY